MTFLAGKRNLTKPKVFARTATKDDMAVLAQLNAEFNGSSDPPEHLARRFSDPYCVEQILLAEVDGNVVGFAALRVVPCVLYSDPHGELTELYVQESFRRLGAGRELLLLAEAIAKEKGVNELIILTDASNQATQSFYRSLGYQDGEIAFTKELDK